MPSYQCWFHLFPAICRFHTIGKRKMASAPWEDEALKLLVGKQEVQRQQQQERDQTMQREIRFKQRQNSILKNKLQTFSKQRERLEQSYNRMSGFARFLPPNHISYIEAKRCFQDQKAVMDRLCEEEVTVPSTVSESNLSSLRPSSRSAATDSESPRPLRAPKNAVRTGPADAAPKGTVIAGPETARDTGSANDHVGSLKEQRVDNVTGRIRGALGRLKADKAPARHKASIGRRYLLYLDLNKLDKYRETAAQDVESHLKVVNVAHVGGSLPSNVKDTSNRLTQSQGRNRFDDEIFRIAAQQEAIAFNVPGSPLIYVSLPLSCCLPVPCGPLCQS